MLLNYGFNTLNLNAINLGVFSFNEVAINCYKKVGFKEIGIQRQAGFCSGKRSDVILMDILKEEFNK